MKISPVNRPQHEALGNKTNKLCSYSPDPHAEVYCIVG